MTDMSSPAQPPMISFIGAFESTYLPTFDVDVAEITGHTSQWRRDIDDVLATGVRRFRYPLRWHRIEAHPGQHDWRETDLQLGYLRSAGAEVIVDLAHHTSYPRWLDDGLRDPRFGTAYLRFVDGAARRYPWLSSYTLFNEPFATLFLAGHEALWPPYDVGVEGFVRLAGNVLPSIGAASRRLRHLLPDARHVWVDTCEAHHGLPGSAAEHADLANDRRFAVLDMALGRATDRDRPFLRSVVAAGGEALLDLDPIQVDVLGLDYYPHSEWWYDGLGGHAPSPHPLGFATVAGQYADRYRLPLMLAETNVRGLPSDRITWLRYMLDQYLVGLSRGLPLEGFCWFPSVDSCDWDSLLARPGQRADPVGVFRLGSAHERQRTIFTDAWETAVRTQRVQDLPAYRPQSPCDHELAGFLRPLTGWPWQDPPEHDTTPAIHIPATRRATVTVPSAPPTRDLVVLSHLRWDWVWQRPQHLVSRFAKRRSGAGAHTWFVEEPAYGPVESPELCIVAVDSAITRVWLVIPEALAGADHPGFDTPGSQDYGDLLSEHLTSVGVRDIDVLLYTAMALDIAQTLNPKQLLYDVMDDLASFRGAPSGLVLRHRRALMEAAHVFTAGRSLYRSATQHRTGPTHLCPSGVETAHFASSIDLVTAHDRPVAGYVGVIDERVDLDLLADLAALLPEWTIRLVGPVTKVDPADLPQGPTIEYPGMAAYQDLPRVMAGFDVALMPFALNEATRSISPTKTLEYLAAGLPVVSTRVPDVVADHAQVVALADDAAGFASACRLAMFEGIEDRVARSRQVAHAHEWDVIAHQMERAMGAGSEVPVRTTGAAYASEAPA